MTVLDKNQNVLWKEVLPMTMVPRKDSTEDSWVLFLKTTAEYQLTKDFLQAMEIGH
jgi:hypothetical protein